jgi:hypothetical protein
VGQIAVRHLRMACGIPLPRRRQRDARRQWHRSLAAIASLVCSCPRLMIFGLGTGSRSRARRACCAGR